MEKFNDKKACPKCGYGNSTIKWEAVLRQEDSGTFKRPPGDPGLITQTCTRCEGKWSSLTLDAKD